MQIQVRKIEPRGGMGDRGDGQTAVTSQLNLDKILPVMILIHKSRIPGEQTKRKLKGGYCLMLGEFVLAGLWVKGLCPTFG